MNDIEFNLNRLEEHSRALLERFAPFQVSDCVELIKAPIITNTECWGWISYKDMLIKGEIGKVIYVDYYDGKFVADVIFGLGADSFRFGEDSIKKI